MISLNSAAIIVKEALTVAVASVAATVTFITIATLPSSSNYWQRLFQLHSF